jgi:surface carbohydrate biosynthesis protein
MAEQAGSGGVPSEGARPVDAAGPRRVLISVPRKARDLEGHTLVAYHLRTRHGCDVAFCTPTDTDARCLEYAPDVLVLEILDFHTRVRQVRLAKRLGMKVVVHPIAGLYADDHTRVAGHRTGATHEVDRYLVWGEWARWALLAGGSISEGQVRVVGSPRTDFYRPPLASLMGRRGDLLATLGFADSRGPVIVWTTNTPAFAVVHGGDVAVCAAIQGVSEAQVRAELEEQRRQFEEHSAVVLELARRHPEWNVIVKVHPCESAAPYSAVFDGVANVRVVSDAPVRDFLHHCDVLLQRGSTTATEGWMLGKPVLEVGVPGYGASSLPADFIAGNHLVAGVDEVEATVGRYLAGASVPEDQRQARAAFIRRIYHRVDGQAAERCAAEIAALLAPTHHSDADSLRVRAAAAAAHAEASAAEGARFSNRVKDALGISRHTPLRPWGALRRNAARRRVARGPAAGPVTAAEVERLYRRYESAYRPGEERSAGSGIPLPGPWELDSEGDPMISGVGGGA